ncbi:MAG: hypothetical protein ACLR1T_03675 [Evtepia gabavorous]
MFRYLKTGLAGLSLPECDQLENYVLTWDIWGSRWTGAGGWTRHPGDTISGLRPRTRRRWRPSMPSACG